MRDLIKRNLNGKKVFSLFLASSSVYFFMLLVTIPYVMTFSGVKKILDMMPAGYSAEYVNSLFNALGEGGRNAYLFVQLPVDMIYPFLFAVSSCLIIAYLLNKIDKFEGNFFYLCFIPIFAGIFDYGENIGIISMLKTYPNNLDMLIYITRTFSILKSSFITAYFLTLTALLLMLGFRKLCKII